MPFHRKGQASCLLGRTSAGASHPQGRSLEHTQSPSLASQWSTRPGEQAALSPTYWKEPLRPGHDDKYGNSVFIGCINISVCTYNSYIIVQGPGGGPRGGPSSTAATSPSPKALPTVQTEANSSCPHLLPGEVTVWGGGQRSRG